MAMYGIADVVGKTGQIGGLGEDVFIDRLGDIAAFRRFIDDEVSF